MPGLIRFSAKGAAVGPGSPRARQIASSEDWLEDVDVAVIGGGIVGTSTALSLAERGVAVALYEKGTVAGEASGRAQGNVTALFQAAEKQSLVALSKRRWRQLNALTGQDTGFRDRPALILADDPAALTAVVNWSRRMNLPDCVPHLMTAAEAAAETGIPDICRAGAYRLTNDATVEPRLAAPAIALGARALGARIYQNCAVRGVERTAGGVSAVITERGRVAVRAVVLAGGLWSRLFLRSLALSLPLLQAHASVMRLKLPEGPDFSGSLPFVSWRREPEGTYTVGAKDGVVPILAHGIRQALGLMPALAAMRSHIRLGFSASTFWRELTLPQFWPLDRPCPFETMRILAPEVRSSHLDSVLAALTQRVPAFARAEVMERWGGALCTTPDNMPVISAVEEIPSLYVGAGFYFGITMGPGAGELLADLVTGKTPQIDLSPYRLSRFNEGKRLRFLD